MKKNSPLIYIFLAFLLFACGKSYETTEAKIVDTQTEGSGMDKYFVATFEYTIEDSTYQNRFELNVWKTIEDTILTPMQGVTFDIQYNPSEPTDILVDYKKKPASAN